MVKRLREAWPEVRIIFRADSGFCRWRTLAWCERNRVGYIIGLAKNSRLDALAEPWMEEAKGRFAESGSKQRLLADLTYAAKTWDRRRRVIARFEHGPKGAKP